MVMLVVNKEKKELADTTDFLLYAQKSLSKQVFTLEYKISGNESTNILSAARIKDIEDYLGCNIKDYNGLKKKGIELVRLYRVTAQLVFSNNPTLSEAVY